MLPDIDGEEICKRIRAHHDSRDVKIISISAVADQEKIQAMHRAGIDMFIPKPFQIADVAAKIESLIGPIRERKQSAVRKNADKILIVAGAVVIAAAIALFFILKPEPAPPAPLPSPGLKKLADLAAFLRAYDANGDKRVVEAENRDMTLDVDGDHSVTLGDALRDFVALLATIPELRSSITPQL